MTPSSSERLSRRRFLALSATAAAGLGLARRSLAGDDALDRAHRPVLHLPDATANGDKVPIRVALPELDGRDHRLTRLAVLGVAGVPLGTFQLSPDHALAEVGFQARLAPGAAIVTATASCDRHGEFTSRRPITIREHVDCSGAPKPLPATGDGAIHAPEIRIAELVERGHLRDGDLLHVAVKVRHPNRAAASADAGAPSLRELVVRYGGAVVVRFEMTPAVSDDPYVTLALRARGEALLDVALVNGRGERLAASYPIRFA